VKTGLKLWSINTDHYYDEAVRLYREKSFDYIELYVVPGTLDTLSKWQALKIPFIIHNAHFMNGFNLAKKESWEDNFKIYQETKRFADALNAAFIIFHGGVDGSIEETARQLKALHEPRALIENKPYKALPNKMNGVICRGSSPDEIKYVLREAQCGFCLDFGHAVCAANSQKVDPAHYIDRFFKLAPAMYHVSDAEDLFSEYDSHAHLGRGQLDIKSILKKLPQNALCTIETEKDSKNDLTDFTEDVIWLKSST
jgi:sugar phosphate isomerase/epimerase